MNDSKEILCARPKIEEVPNFAYLQLNGAGAPAAASHDVSRGRSKSGILFASSSSRESAAAAAAAAAASDQTTVEYAICKPVVP